MASTKVSANFANKEAEDLERALEESRRDYYRKTRSEPEPEPLLEAYRKPDPKTDFGRDREMDLVILRLGVEVDHLNFPDADTLVLIDAPPRPKDQSLSSYTKILSHYANFHCVHSDKLLDMGSKKFEMLLSVNKQTRQQRTLKKILPDGKPPGIKYVLDLRPPSEDEEAILLVTELSCTSGVLKWHKAGQHFHVSPQLIKGQDDIEYLDAPEDPLFDAKESTDLSQENAPVKPELSVIFDRAKETKRAPKIEKSKKSKKEPPPPPRVMNWDGNLPKPPPIQAEDVTEATYPQQKPPSPQLPSEQFGSSQPPRTPCEHEYSPLRHRSSIERVLSAIEYQDPNLDSAPKMWNYFAIAKHFDCATHERVNGWITKWLFAYPNVNFIQCNPEVCYRIGLGINSYDLTRDAFSILVGEQALMRVHNGGRAVGNESVHGRTREYLDDDEQNRVTHAADQFVTRISGLFSDLIGVRHEFLAESHQYDELLSFLPDNEYEELITQSLIRHLRGYVRLRILAALYTGSTHYMTTMSPPSLHLEADTTSLEGVVSGCASLRKTYSDLSGRERIFTRTFWLMLSRENFSCDTFHTSSTSMTRAEDLWDILCPSFPGLETLPMVSLRELEEFANSYNRMRTEKPLRIATKNAMEIARQDVELLDNNTEAMQNLSMSSPKRAHESSPGIAPSDDLQKRRRLIFEGMRPQMVSDEEPKPVTILQNLPIRTRFDSVPKSLLESRRVPETTVENRDDENNQLTQDYLGSQPHELGSAFDQRSSSPSSIRANIDIPAPDPTLQPVVEGDGSDCWGRFNAAEANLYSSSFKFPFQGASLDLGGDRRRKIDEFDLHKFLDDVNIAVANITFKINDPPHLWHINDRLPTQLIDTLMCLDEEEWKYLPLWAGGNDDGTGGVFDETDVPNIEAGGFSAPGPSIHTGQTPATSMVDGEDAKSQSDDFSDIASEARSTVGRASAIATDGTVTDTSIRSAQSIAMSEIEANGSDMDPLWTLIREEQAGISDFESTVDGEEDDTSIIALDKGKGRMHQGTSNYFLPNDLNPHLDISQDDDDMYDDNDTATELVPSAGSEAVEEEEEEEKEDEEDEEDEDDDDDDDDEFMIQAEDDGDFEHVDTEAAGV